MSEKDCLECGSNDGTHYPRCSNEGGGRFGKAIRGRRLPAATAHESARNAAQNELFAARRSLKMAQDAKDELWTKNAGIREAAALATLARLDAK